MAVTNDSREWDRQQYQRDLKMKVEQHQAKLLNAQVYAQAMRERVMDESPAYSMAEVEMVDGKTQTFMIKAAPRISQHLLTEMQDKGFLIMWNDTDVLCIRADQVKQFTLRAFTQEK